MKHVLIVSPIPSHPQYQGNSARIFRLNRMFQLLGYKLHFVYFGMEGLSSEQEELMRNTWDYFYFVQPEGPAANPSFGEYFDIDDWYDQRVSQLVDELQSKWHFDVCVTNYVWFSKVLDVLPASTKKIIDTHDVFGDRHIVAKNAGLEPVWFYTTKELEAVALARADLVFAIQDEEKNYFESISKTPVEVMGYVTPEQKLPVRKFSENQKIVIGYIGSGNPFNVQSLLKFQEAVMASPELMLRFTFVLAGTICKSFQEYNEIFISLGMVDELDDFYQDIDIAINPMVGGTGLKIKSLEALSFGRPLIGTQDAMVGIEVFDALQACGDVPEMVESLYTVDHARMQILYDNSMKAFTTYNHRFITKFKELFA
jgi:glycosyltransferase involved in cell wall biosynthesis